MLATFGFLVALVLVCVAVVFFVLGKRSQTMTVELGLQASELTQCPDAPNCVCSFARDKLHTIEPIYGGVDAFNVLSTHLKQDSHVRIEREAEGYLHATLRSKLFGFVDDLELWLDGDEIHVRSASRVGHSDLGANRKRIEALRQLVTHS